LILGDLTTDSKPNLSPEEQMKKDEMEKYAFNYTFKQKEVIEDLDEILKA
jgi:hypothetical protein